MNRDIEEARAWIARSKEVLARNAPQRPIGSVAVERGAGHVYLRGEDHNPVGRPAPVTLRNTRLSELPGAARYPERANTYLASVRKPRSVYSTQGPEPDVWQTPFGEIDVVASVPRVRDVASAVDSPVMSKLASRVSMAQSRVVASQAVLNAAYAAEEGGPTGPTPARTTQADARSSRAFARPTRSMISKAVQTMPESTWKTDASTSTDEGAFPPTRRVMARTEATRNVVAKSQSLLSSYHGGEPAPGTLPQTPHSQLRHAQPVAQPGASVTTNTTLTPYAVGPPASRYLVPDEPAPGTLGAEPPSPYTGLPDAMRTAALVLSGKKATPLQSSSSSYMRSKFPPPSRAHEIPFPSLTMTPLVRADRGLSPSSLRRSFDASASIGLARALQAADTESRMQFSAASRDGQGVHARNLTDSLAFGAAGTASDASTRAHALDIVHAREAVRHESEADSIARLHAEVERLQREKHELHVLNSTLQNELVSAT